MKATGFGLCLCDKTVHHFTIGHFMSLTFQPYHDTLLPYPQPLEMPMSMNNKRTEILTHTIDRIREMRDYNADLLDDKDQCDLHSVIFNESHYIIGYFQGKEWLGEDTFEALGMIQEYEQSNFGETTTDLSSSEAVANMLAYILGEEAMEEAIDTIKSEREDVVENAFDDLMLRVDEEEFEFAAALESIQIAYTLSSIEREELENRYDELNE